MEGITHQATPNDHDQYNSHIGAQPEKSVQKYYLTIPTAWTEEGGNVNLPEETRPEHHHVGSRSVYAAMEMIYISTAGLHEIGDVLHVALASRSMNRASARPPTRTALHPLLNLELIVDRDWLLVDQSIPTLRADLQVATATHLSLRGVLGLIEAIQWELDRRGGRATGR